MPVRVCIITSILTLFGTRIFHKETKSRLKTGYEVIPVAQHKKNDIVDGIMIFSLAKARNRIERMTKTVWQVYRKALKVDADIYYLHDLELMPL